MDYKEKYKQGLECIQEILSGAGDSIKTSILRKRLQPFFPELKENKSERVRKGLIKTISSLLDNTILYHTDITKEEALAWLEKQGEKNELKKVEQGNHPRIVMADFTGGEGFYKLNLDNLNKEQVTAIEIMINNPKPGKKIDADKVIEWLVANICDFEYYVKLFKKDFGL